jgi:twitching motility protein PilT
MIGTPAIRNLIREGKIAQMYSSIQPARRPACRRSISVSRTAAEGRHLKEEARHKAQNKEI